MLPPCQSTTNNPIKIIIRYSAYYPKASHIIHPPHIILNRDKAGTSQPENAPIKNVHDAFTKNIIKCAAQSAFPIAE